MTEDESKQDQETLEFTREGETLGYISLDQATVLAMRVTRDAPGAYGRRFRNVPMAFEIVEDTETEDHYIVMSFRPEGPFTGTPGRGNSSSSKKRAPLLSGRCSAFLLRGESAVSYLARLRLGLRWWQPSL